MTSDQSYAQRTIESKAANLRGLLKKCRQDVKASHIEQEYKDTLVICIDRALSHLSYEDSNGLTGDAFGEAVQHCINLRSKLKEDIRAQRINETSIRSIGSGTLKNDFLNIFAYTDALIESSVVEIMKYNNQQQSAPPSA